MGETWPLLIQSGTDLWPEQAYSYIYMIFTDAPDTLKKKKKLNNISLVLRLAIHSHTVTDLTRKIDQKLTKLTFSLSTATNSSISCSINGSPT